MILALHTRYRTTGGEERAVHELVRLAREELGETVELLERSSDALGRRDAAIGLARGGLHPAEVGEAVRRTGADVVHAHNLLPAFGWRALAAAKAAGAATVLHLHNYRLVCAVGTCIDPSGADCTRCHGRDTRPGVRLGCRGSRAEAVVYAGALAAWQRRTVEHADVVVVPSEAARDRLRRLGAPVGRGVRVVPHVVRAPEGEVRGGTAGGAALVVSRLAPEKGVEVALDACARAGLGLVVAGDGPSASSLRARAGALGLRVTTGPGPSPAAGEVRFTGRVDDAALADLRASASVALVPSLAHETFGLAAVEALAAGLPVIASAVGALAALPAPTVLVPPADVAALADALPMPSPAVEDARTAGPEAAARAAGADVVAPALAAAYAAARAA